MKLTQDDKNIIGLLLEFNKRLEEKGLIIPLLDYRPEVIISRVNELISDLGGRRRYIIEDGKLKRKNLNNINHDNF